MYYTMPKLRKKNDGSEYREICGGEIPSRNMKHINSTSYDYVRQLDSLTLRDSCSSVPMTYSESVSELDSSLPYFDCDSETVCSDDSTIYCPSNSTFSGTTMNYCKSSIYSGWVRGSSNTISRGSSSVASYSTQDPSCDDSTYPLHPDNESVLSFSPSLNDSYGCEMTRPSKRRRCADEYKLNSEFGDRGHSNNSELNSETCNLPFLPFVIANMKASWAPLATTFSLLIVLIFLITLLITIVSVPVCEKFDAQSLNVAKLSEDLSECLIGHDEFTVPVIAEAFKSFRDMEDSLHFMWWVGPVGVGKSYAKQIVRNSLNSSVQFFHTVSSLVAAEGRALEEEVELLVRGFDLCGANVLFIDGYDADSSIVISYLKIFIKKIYQIETVKLRLLVIVIGTSGSKFISENYLKHVEQLRTRPSFPYDAIQNEIKRASPFSFIGKRWRFTTVPFLPLHVSHVEKCVIQQLNYIYNKLSLCSSHVTNELERFVEERNWTVQGIQDAALEVLHVRGAQVIKEGCKRTYYLTTGLLHHLPVKTASPFSHLQEAEQPFKVVSNL